MTTIFRGPGFEDSYIQFIGAIYMIPVIPVAVEDEITVLGVVETYDGDPISVRHGEREVGIVENSGMFTRSFTADHDGNEFTLVPTGATNHRIGHLEISKA